MNIMNFFTACIRWIIWVDTFIWIYLNLCNLRASNNGTHQRLAKRLKRCGILGIKVGQYLSNRHEFMGKECCYILSRSLLDQVPPHPYRHTMQILESSSFNEFLHVEESVLGSGSVAQVHSCRIRSDPDQEYVVKILHPHVIELYEDLWFFRKILPILGYITHFNIHWEDMLNSISVQTDLRKEAENIRSIARKCQHFRNLDIPTVIFYSESFLVMTKCHGTSSYKSKISQKQRMFQAALFFYLTMLDGMFHGDMHSGNILINPNGNMALLDFGICPTIPKTTVFTFVNLMEDQSFSNLQNVLDILCIRSIPQNTQKRIHEEFKQRNLHVCNDLSVVLNVLMDMMMNYGFVLNANVTLWILQYSYLEKNMQYSDELFILRVVRFMSKTIAFRVNIPSIDLIFSMLNNDRKSRNFKI